MCVGSVSAQTLSFLRPSSPAEQTFAGLKVLGAKEWSGCRAGGVSMNVMSSLTGSTFPPKLRLLNNGPRLFMNNISVLHVSLLTSFYLTMIKRPPPHHGSFPAVSSSPIISTACFTFLVASLAFLLSYYLLSFIFRSIVLLSLLFLTWNFSFVAAAHSPQPLLSVPSPHAALDLFSNFSLIPLLSSSSFSLHLYSSLWEEESHARPRVDAQTHTAAAG